MKADWPLTTLGEILTERQQKLSIDAILAGEVPIVSKIGFDDGTIELRDNFDTKTGMIQIEPGDLVLSGINAAKGAIAIYDVENPGPIAATIHYSSYIPNKEKVHIRYLWWFLRSNEFREILNRCIPGGIKTELKAKRLLPIPIPLPPLYKQQRIVSKIEQLAAKIEEALSLRHEAIIETEAFSKSIELVLFQKLLKDHPQESLKDLISLSSGEQLNKTELGDSYEFAVYGGGGYVGRYHRYLFEEPKIGIGRVGARCGCIYMTEPKAWITDNSLYVKEYSGRLEMDYLLFVLKSLDLRRQANQAAQPVISQKRINPLKIPFPPNHEQRIIVDYIKSLQQKVYKLKRQQDQTAAELDALLPSILDKAFKGEL